MKEKDKRDKRTGTVVLFALALMLFTASLVSAGTVTYDYDDAGRLVKADYGNGTAIEYEYDDAGNLLVLNVTGAEEGQPPNITSFAPPSPVNDTICTWRTFNVTVNQTVNVSWYLNDSHLFSNVSVIEANCTLHAEVAGEHNVSAFASNINGTDMQTWIWNVTALPIASVEIEKWVKYKNEQESEYRKAISDAKVCDNVTFKIVIQNNGTDTNLTDILVTDALNCSLGYINGSASIPLTIYENHCPDNQTFIWQFPGIWLEPGEYINITFDAHVDECGNDTNYVHVEAENETGYSVSDEGTVWVNCTPPGTPVETATGTGIAYFATDAGTIEGLIAVDEATLPAEGKPALVFPHGFFSFDIIGLTPGQTVVVTITLPDNVPVGTEYWKYHASEGGWIQIPMGSDDGDNVITITLVDGGLGDDDGTANGVIVDQGGPGIPKPDLVITEKYETFVDGGSFNITYKVNNIGCADAGASNTTIYIDGVPLEVPTPAIPRGECHENTVGPFDCPCGVTLNVTVCADNDNVVDESNETNNCKVNEVECPKLPDLVIEEIWTKERRDRCKVYFVVKNIGCVPAPRGHYATLFVNGQAVEEKRIRKLLGPGEQYESYFRIRVSCTDDIRVCADNTNVVDESGETNNCWPPIVEKPDLVIEDKREEWVNETHYNVTYVVHNKGTVMAPGGHRTTLYVDGVAIEHKIVPDDLEYCETYTDTFDTVIECTGGSDTIRVCADNDEIIDEINEDNNCLKNEWTCEAVEKPDLIIEDIWTRERRDRCRVYFVVENIGTATAPRGHYATLLVNGQPVEEKRVRRALGPGEQYKSSFRTTVSCTDAIEVCADNFKVVDELDETNNCLEYGKP